jgi:nitroimidazol reductase NimA-like FMN-containing flavoprotein (pyridoxamine 5'-phosphate oxidase superfamily)
VGKTKVLPEKFGTEYESAVVFGVASEVYGNERQDALLWLLEKYCSDYIEEGKQYIEQKDKLTKVFKIEIDQISGKARR